MIYYILYAAFASLSGGILGVSIGFKIFPTVIGNAYRMMYNIPTVNAVFRPVYAVVIVALSVAIVVLTTFFACRDTLAEKPSALMLPKSPKAGKRVWLEHIGVVWKRMKFTQKITVRNLFRYKKPIIKATSELGLENDVVITATLKDKKTFEQYKNALPFYQSVLREGVKVAV